MKPIKLFLASLLTLNLQSAFAIDKENFCRTNSNLAGAVMRARQAGVSLEESLRIHNSIANEELKPINYLFIKMAYNYPMYYSLENKYRAEIDMKNHVYLTCLDSFAKM